MICLASTAKPLKPHSRASGAHPHFPTWDGHVCSKAHVLLLILNFLGCTWRVTHTCTDTYVSVCNRRAVTWRRWAPEGELWWQTSDPLPQRRAMAPGALWLLRSTHTYTHTPQWKSLLRHKCAVGLQLQWRVSLFVILNYPCLRPCWLLKQPPALPSLLLLSCKDDKWRSFSCKSVISTANTAGH